MFNEQKDVVFFIDVITHCCIISYLAPSNEKNKIINKHIARSGILRLCDPELRSMAYKVKNSSNISSTIQRVHNNLLVMQEEKRKEKQENHSFQPLQFTDGNDGSDFALKSLNR